jgi:transcriptional regulator GlxA family with amidase domain
MRFEKAKRQLAVPGSSDDSVASFCGYDSASTLRKLFARRLGKPPSLWKKSMRH